MKNKFFIIIGFVIITLIITTTSNVAMNLKNYGIENNIEKALVISELTKENLTTLMQTHQMDQREHFLNNLTTLRGVLNAWVIRSDTVKKDFGIGLNNEQIRDEIDKIVLESGEEQIQIQKDNILRVTIPYKASSQGTLNCLSCHVSAQEGETLGGISMEFDLSKAEVKGLYNLMKFVAINLGFFILIVIITVYLLNPYLKFASSLKKVLIKAKEGDFSSRMDPDISGEAKDITIAINELFEKIDKTLIELKKGLKSFLKNQSNEKDPLVEAEHVIKNMSDIYSFKKIIEQDSDISDIYYRLFIILKNDLKIKHFYISEVNHKLGTKKTKFRNNVSDDEIICSKQSKTNLSDCRCIRNDQLVHSTSEDSLCRTCNVKKFLQIPNYNYYCIPFDIDNEYSLVINIYYEKEQEKEYNYKYNAIIDYLEIAKPVMKSVILLTKLEESSYKDPLTNLFNRRYIDRHIYHELETIQQYCILMIDIDHFKSVNDTYGHDAGDIIIKELAKLLRNFIADKGVPIRFGGEEFLIYLPNYTRNQAFDLANRMKERFVVKKFMLNGDQVSKTISIGLASFNREKENASLHEIIKNADNALYSAKDKGRNRIEVWSS